MNFPAASYGVSTVVIPETCLPASSSVDRVGATLAKTRNENPATLQRFTFLDTRFCEYDERGKPRGIKPKETIKIIRSINIGDKYVAEK